MACLQARALARGMPAMARSNSSAVASTAVRAAVTMALLTKHVQPAVGRDGRRHQRPQVVLAQDVAVDVGGHAPVGPDALDHRPAGLVLDVRHHDAGALLGEAPRGALADAVGRPGHDGHLAAQAHSATSPCMVRPARLVSGTASGPWAPGRRRGAAPPPPAGGPPRGRSRRRRQRGPGVRLGDAVAQPRRLPGSGGPPRRPVRPLLDGDMGRRSDAPYRLLLLPTC